MFERPRSGERAVLVRIGLGSPVDPEDVAEFDALARSAGALPVASLSGSRAHPDPKYFVGSGKADEVRAAAEAHKADVVLVDHALSPSQERNLEKLSGRRVLDRNGLILDIFAQRARSFEGKLQVELAQLKHMATRLVRGWTHLERQKGGIGLRGPGETQLELDRRMIGHRIALLERQIEEVHRHREQYRERRRKSGVPIVALVGYTNAGKSTLLNALSGANVRAEDRLFATLDPTTRQIGLPGGQQALLTDTVGFIQKLPTQLVAAFRATLEEIREADVLLHVLDITHKNAAQQTDTVLETLKELRADHRPVITVLNKVDLMDGVDEREVGRLAGELGLPDDYVAVSAQRGWGLEALLGRIEETLGQRMRPIEAFIPYKRNDLVALWHQRGVVDAEQYEADGTRISGRVPAAIAAQIAPFRLSGDGAGA